MTNQDNSNPPIALSERPRIRSIQGRLLTLSIGMTLVAIIVIAAVAIDSANNVSRRAQEASSLSLRTQVEEYLTQMNKTIAEQNDLVLDRANRDVKAIVASAVDIFSNPTIQTDTFWSVEEHMFYGPQGQYMNGPEDISSVFVPSTRNVDPKVIEDIELGAYLDLIMKPIFENNPNAAAVYFGTETDVTRYYPNVNLGEVLPHDFQVTWRPWYTEAEQSLDKTEPVWSAVYLDATGLGLVTTVAMPVYNPQGGLIGVVGLDLTLEEIRANLEAAQFLETGYSFLIDKNGMAIILPDQGYQDFFGRLPEADEFGPDLKSGTQALRPVIDRMLNGETGFLSVKLPNIQAGQRELFIAFAPLKSTGWSLGSVVATEEVLKSIPTLQNELRQTTRSILLTRVLPIVLVVAIALIALGFILTDRIVTPIQELAGAAQRIGEGQLDVTIPVTSKDEIGLLGKTLENMARRLRQYFAELEQRVAERTQQLEYRSLQLQTAAEVARDLTTARRLEALLEDAVNLINDRFGFYNVGVFLVDERGEYAHLTAASGEAGRRLVQQGIKLRVGEQGIVGFVTKYGTARVVPDVRKEDIYLEVPLLTDTRSEATIPLRVGNRILGALDVQSAQEAAFESQDITVLQTLGDQLAIAIENARLVEQYEIALREARITYQSQAKLAWENMLRKAGYSGFEYDQLEVKPITKLDASLVTSESPHRLVVPVRLRDQVIGSLILEHEDPEHRWSEDESVIVEAIANHVAITLENARLLEETQNRAAQESLFSEIASHIRQSLDVETVLRTAVQEIQRTLKLPEVVVSLSPLPREQSPSPDNGDDGK